jgi:3-oxoacyl-[acyl-carrier-protein] synthase III
MRLAAQLLASGAGRKALIVLAQRCAGTAFDQKQVRKLAQAAIPGDGAAAGLLTLSDHSPILGIECRSYGEYADDMAAISDPPREWWQPGPGEGYISLADEATVAQVLARGNRLVPEVVQVVCDRIGVRSKDLDLLVTNQPNQLFLRNWDKELELPPHRHRDTFNECGNLFGVGIPMNLDFAINDDQVKPGDVVMMAAFAHAGDFAGAAAIRWGGRPR